MGRLSSRSTRTRLGGGCTSEYPRYVAADRREDKGLFVVMEFFSSHGEAPREPGAPRVVRDLFVVRPADRQQRQLVTFYAHSDFLRAEHRISIELLAQTPNVTVLDPSLLTRSSQILDPRYLTPFFQIGRGVDPHRIIDQAFVEQLRLHLQRFEPRLHNLQGAWSGSGYAYEVRSVTHEPSDEPVLSAVVREGAARTDTAPRTDAAEEDVLWAAAEDAWTRALQELRELRAQLMTLRAAVPKEEHGVR